MRNGKVYAKPMGGRIAMTTKGSRAYRSNTRRRFPKKPKGLELAPFDIPLVFDLTIAEDALAIQDFNLFDLLEADSSNDNIYILTSDKIEWRADLWLAINNAIS